MLGKNSIDRRRSPFQISAIVLMFAVPAACLFPEWLRAVTDEGTATPDETSQQLPAIPDQELLESLNSELASLLSTLWNTSESDAARLDALRKVRPLLAALPADQARPFRSRLNRWLNLLEAEFAAAAVTDLQPQNTDLTAALKASGAALLQNVKPEDQQWLQLLPIQPLLETPSSSPAIEAFLDSIRQRSEQPPEHRAFLLSPAVQQVKTDAEKVHAASKTWPDDQATAAARSAALKTLTAEIFKNEIRPSADISERIRSQWRFLRSRFPKTADVLWPTISQNVMNHNIHISFSEGLLGRLISDYRTESGCVSDIILGARVTGTQTTSVKVTADVTPSANTAAFQLKLSGNTRSETAAQKDPATVYTSGNHYFWIDKPFEFDGNRVTLGSSRFSVDTNSQTRGFRTKFDGVPLVGMIVRGAAKHQIASSKPKSEAITAQKLRNQAQPKFDSESSAQFDRLNGDLQSTLDALRAKDAAPDIINARSSNTHAAISTRTLGTARVGGSAAPEIPPSPETGVLQIHESAVNATLDALALHGRVIPADKLNEELEKALSNLLNREIKLRKNSDTAAATTTPATEAAPQSETEPAGDEPAGDEPPTSWVFNGRDPIQVQFLAGRVTIILQAAIRREGQPDIARHSVLIPLAITLQNDKLVINPDPIRIIRTARTSVAVANQIRNIVQKRVKASEASAVINLQPNADQPLPLTISALDIEDGWLTLQVR
ncbi:MAG: hypothetical protein ACKO2L_08900 [Planctomycetaceae bacterium]